MEIAPQKIKELLLKQPRQTSEQAAEQMRKPLEIPEEEMETFSNNSSYFGNQPVLKPDGIGVFDVHGGKFL